MGGRFDPKTAPPGGPKSPLFDPPRPLFDPPRAGPPKVPKTARVQLFGGPCTKADLDILGHLNTAWTILILDPPPPKKFKQALLRRSPPGGPKTALLGPPPAPPPGGSKGAILDKIVDLRRIAKKVDKYRETLKTANSGVWRSK